MTRITAAFWLLLLILTGFWLAADPVYASPHVFAALRNSLINYTGIVAMGMMSVSMLLAVRWARAEPLVGGLDKSYRLHKWLGIGALVFALLHWFWIKGRPVFSALGWGAGEKRGAAGHTDGLALLHSLKGAAQGVGGWAFYALVLLVVLALIRRFPYRYFLATHRLLVLVYLVLVFHTVVLMRAAYWTHGIAWVVAALLLVGTAASVFILFRRVGQTRQVVGEIEAVTQHADVNVLEVVVRIRDRWKGHHAGQFAFVHFGDDEEPHPFTISSSWADDGRLSFLIKGLGDYTRALPSTLTPGAVVTVEGPYGEFNFLGGAPRQIWVSAGIGITPFVSRMQTLAQQPDGKIIDLFHATARRDIDAVSKLRQLAESAGVRLHVWVAAEDGLLTGERLRTEIPEWRSADLWFCGPVEFGTSLRRDMHAAGMPSSAFHQELFHLR